MNNLYSLQALVGFSPKSRTWSKKFGFLPFSHQGTLGLVMKKGIANQHNPDLLDEYDFSQGVQGKYVRKYREGTNIVRLDDDEEFRKNHQPT